MLSNLDIYIQQNDQDRVGEMLREPILRRARRAPGVRRRNTRRAAVARCPVTRDWSVRRRHRTRTLSPDGGAGGWAAWRVK